MSGTRFSISQSMDALGLAAIALAPTCSLFLPGSVKKLLVFPGLELKDAILLACFAALAIALFGIRLASFLYLIFKINPYYENVRIEYFYQPDGTVTTRTHFSFVNGWKRAERLPEESLIWHRPIGPNDIMYRLYQRGDLGDRDIDADSDTQIAAIPQLTESASDYRYSWTPRIRPALRLKERVSFIVEIVSEKTELDAFEAGTKLGFGFQIPSNSVSLTAYAPFGHRFTLIEPKISVRRSSDLVEIAVSPRKKPVPVTSPDGTVVTLKLRRTKPGRRYWIHYRFDKMKTRNG